jgi:hypothetical protein
MGFVLGTTGLRESSLFSRIRTDLSWRVKSARKGARQHTTMAVDRSDTLHRKGGGISSHRVRTNCLLDRAPQVKPSDFVLLGGRADYSYTNDRKGHGNHHEREYARQC